MSDNNSMDGTEKFWVWINGIIVFGVVAFASIVASCDTKQTEMFIKNGYTKVSLPGQSESKWVKP